MDAKLQGRLIAALMLLAMPAIGTAQQPRPPLAPAAAAPAKRHIDPPLPALTLPDRPSLAGKRPPAPPVAAFDPLAKGGALQKGGAGNAQPKSRAEIAATAALNHYERQQREIATASAPLSDFAVKFPLWGPPHGVFMTRLRSAILQANAAGNFAERDRLMQLYRPWAEKYLNPDSTTWSKSMLRPGQQE